MNHIDTWTAYAQGVLKNPRWWPWKFDSTADGHILITGAECPLKKDGKPNFRKRDKMTQCVVVYPIRKSGDAERPMENVRVKDPLQRSRKGRSSR